VDAGGSDGTMLIAVAAAAELASILAVRTDVSARGGRGPTLSAGVAAARGSVLLFLHADTLLPEGFDVAVRSALREERVLATAFQFKVARDAVRRKRAGVGRRRTLGRYASKGKACKPFIAAVLLLLLLLLSLKQSPPLYFKTRFVCVCCRRRPSWAWA